MAKRHKGEDAESEEEYQFIPPEFDEDQFIHKEMVSFHTTTVLFLAGIVAALVSWAVFAAVDGARTGWLFGLIIVAVVFAGLRVIFRVLNIDIAHWARREWFGTAFLLFFAWLAFFIMFVNPPISDFADPELDVYVSPGAAAAGDDMVIDLFFADNGKIADRDFSLTGPNGTIAGAADLEHVVGAHYRYVLEDAPAGTYTWTAAATDGKGRVTEANGTALISANVLRVIVGDLTDPLGTVFVDVPDGVNVYAVYADIVGGDRVYLEADEKVGGYVATRNFKGWLEGEQTFTIHVEERNRFHGQTPIPGGHLEAGPFNVDVADPGTYDKGIPKKANPTKAPVRAVPGLELPLLAVGLIAVVAIKRRR